MVSNCRKIWSRASFPLDGPRRGETPLGEPGLELRRRAKAQQRASGDRVMITRRLIVEHHVVGAGDAHEEVAAGRREQKQQVVGRVLVGVGVVGVADVDPHRQAQQLAHEVVFQPRADDLPLVEQVLGADEADDAVDQERVERARDAVAPGPPASTGRSRGARRPRARCPGRSRSTSTWSPDPGDVAAVVAARAPRSRPSRSSPGRRRSSRLAASVPATDWNSRSTGAPRSRQAS